MYPSLHEGFGIPLVEAMRFRKPIVCGRCTSIPEIAGSAELYANVKDPVELAASMKMMAEDGELRARLVAAGEGRLQQFSISREVAKLAEMLLIAKRNNNRAVVFRRCVIHWERERRRVAAAFRRRMSTRAVWEIAGALKAQLYQLKMTLKRVACLSPTTSPVRKPRDVTLR